MKNHEKQLMDVLDLMETFGILDDWLEEQAINAENERLYEKGFGA
jgi:hypothetical protein